MKIIRVPVKDLRKVHSDVYLLSFLSPTLVKKASPGQFLHIKIDSSVLLRRPLSIHRVKGNEVFILFRVRGKGTQSLAHYKKDDVIDVLGPLGKGFTYTPPSRQVTKPPVKKEKRILVAGGMGVAPLLFLGERIKKSQVTSHKSQVQVLLGGKTKRDILCENEFKKLGFSVRVATEDGSKGIKGTAVGLLKKNLSTMDRGLSTNIYACGPTEMFGEIGRVVKKYAAIHCEVSFEQFMGCGVGLCQACVIKTRAGYKRVCKDGPVFNLKEIMF